MKFNFYKYQGTGNDFVILDNRDHSYDSITNEMVNLMCDRRFGIGADGLMLMNNKDGFDFEMIYYNSDGKLGTMCGNGGRCMVRFAYDMGIHKYTYHFMATDGAHLAEIDMNNQIRLKMKDVNEVDDHATFAILNTGSPHFVKFVTDILNVDVAITGRDIRNSKQFIDDGINVNFVETTEDDAIFVRTYERGVEDETLSCGTGVTACALMSAHNTRGFNRVKVKTHGGNLSVEFNKDSDTQFSDIWLCGPAKFVFKGVFETEE